EGFGDVSASFQLALDDQAQSRALHPSDREKVRAEAPGGERDGPGKGGAPEQIDVLTCRAGVGKRVRELVEVVEGLNDLGAGQGRVAGALDSQAAVSSSLARA